MIKPSPHIMHLTAIRRLVNFQKIGTPKERHNRTEKQSSYAESHNFQAMKPLIPANEDLDLQERFSNSIEEIIS
jgi:hypothetical protein